MWFDMCGFVAVMQEKPVIPPPDRRVLDSLEHRGPDAVGEWREGGIYLGHRRLSIIDLESGNQPMESADGRYVIVFNGEIYNYRELRERLIRAGAVFRTQSDTEVILEGYRHWSANVVDRMEGMFAFVVWDRDKRVAFIARDRLGIKPLCWAYIHGGLIIASTLEPFFALGLFSRLDLRAVRDLLAFDYISAPRTILRGVQKLEPGSRFEWRPGAGAPSIEHFWSPPLEDVESPAPDEDEMEHLLDRAVRKQMVGDVPIGAFLSGGVDSSLLVALMSRHSSRPIRTFSVAFDGAQFDESAIAAVVARRFGTDHTELRSEEMDSEGVLRLLGRLDEPFCDPAIVPTFVLSEMTRRHVKVSLCGDGGDEVFGGYSKYLVRGEHRPAPRFFPLVHHALAAMPFRPRGISHFYRRFLSSKDEMRFSWTRYGDFPVFRKDMRQLLAESYREACAVGDYFSPWELKARRYGSELNADVLMRADLETYLSENCLVKTDRAGMLASLEVRVPYVDESLLQRILPLSAERRIVDGQLKALLMPLVRRLLPEEVWKRPKHGFNVSLDVALAGKWRLAVESALAWGDAHFPLFDYRYLRRLHAINLSEGGVSRELWNPFVLIAWAMARSQDGNRLYV